MSKERELLKECRLMLDNPINGTAGRNLQIRITELLAQPEQEPEFNFDLERMKAAIESPISDVTVDDLAKQVKQEPVAWMYDWDDEHERTRINLLTTDKEHTHLKTAFNIQPLYTSLPAREPSASAREMYQRGYAKAELGLKREPLREDQIFMERNTLNCFEYRDGFVDGVKLAEKAHGIGECNSHYKERHETFGEEV